MIIKHIKKSIIRVLTQLIASVSGYCNIGLNSISHFAPNVIKKIKLDGSSNSPSYSSSCRGNNAVCINNLIDMEEKQVQTLYRRCVAVQSLIRKCVNNQSSMRQNQSSFDQDFFVDLGSMKYAIRNWRFPIVNRQLAIGNMQLEFCNWQFAISNW